jgi:hypothetical protein
MEPLRRFLFFVYTESPYQQIAFGLGCFLVVVGFFWLVCRAFSYRFDVGVGVLLLPLVLAGTVTYFALTYSINPHFLIASIVLVLVVLPTLYAILLGRATAFPLLMMLLGAIILAAPGPLDYIGWLTDTRPRIIMLDNRPTLTLTGVPNPDYSELETMPHLILLQMANKDVTDDIVARLAGLKELKELDLDSTQITDAGLAVLAKLPLEIVHLEHTAITTEGFKTHLAPMPTLKTIYLRGTGVDYDVAKAWQKEKEGRRAIIVRPKKGDAP